MVSKKHRKKDISSQAGKRVRIRKKDLKKVEVPEKPSITLSRRKLWLFRIIAIAVVPAILFVFLEIGLRLAGYGYPTSVAVRYKDKEFNSYYSNIRFTWLFFDPKIARTFSHFMFPVKKSEETYRVFVMGASAAAGTPDSAYSFGRMLKVMLRKQYPGTNFEVIVAATPAINSHAVFKIAKDCTKYDPDLYIVYLGNNEVVGPYGAGTVFAPLSDNISLIRFGIALKSLKVGQLLTNLTGMMGGDSPEVWMGLEMFLDKQVRKNDSQLNVVYKNYKRNLTDICKVAVKNKIPVICSTVGSNLKDSPPFASLHRADLTDSEKEQWEQLYQQGISSEEKEEYSSAIDIYLEAAEIDPDYADLQFRLGRCYYEMENFEESKSRLIMAREQDTLRFRADSQINTIIRETTGNKTNDGIYFVDACKVFEEDSPNEITDHELFYEHVHLNFHGNYILAQALFHQVQKILPERIKINSSGDSSFPSEQEVARYLAYTDWEKYNIISSVVDGFFKHPPFTNQLYNDERIEQEEQKVEALKAALTKDMIEEVERQYIWAIKQTPTDPWLYFKYGLMLENQNDISSASMQYEVLLKYQPIHDVAYARLALCYSLLGETAKAIEYNLKAIKLAPNLDLVYYNLGLIYHRMMKYDKAIENYEKAISLNPMNAEVYYNYALLLRNQGKINEAIDMFYTGIKFVPDNIDLHYGLAVILNEQGQVNAAVDEFLETLNLDPDHAEARKAVESLMNWNINSGSGMSGWN